jgi:hypothetical protein
MSRSSLSSKIIGFCITAAALGACQSVAGIEDRTLDPDALAPSSTPQCKEYCSVVMDACKGTNAVYTTEPICLGVCAHLDPGDDEDTSGNTIACRLYQANIAKDEPDDYCKGAGPGGNDVCGTDCEAYCQIFPQVCPGSYEYQSTEDCLKFCEALPSQPDYDVMRDHAGDTIECRLVHTSSATTKPDDHCPHAPIRPTEPWCIGKAEGAPSCDDYCSIELAACQGELAQYESLDQCKAVCKELLPGTNDDEGGNTVACRRYHSFNSTLLPATHCSHSGPVGDGHCGHDDAKAGTTGNCEAYCRLVEAACPDEFAASSIGSAEACMAECVGLPEAGADSKYSLVAAAESHGLSCRVLHVVRAFEDKAACASALGGDQCKPLVDEP